MNLKWVGILKTTGGRDKIVTITDAVSVDEAMRELRAYITKTTSGNIESVALARVVAEPDVEDWIAEHKQWQRKERERQQEVRDREEYERLKAKFGDR